MEGVNRKISEEKATTEAAYDSEEVEQNCFYMIYIDTSFSFVANVTLKDFKVLRVAHKIGVDLNDKRRDQ